MSSFLPYISMPPEGGRRLAFVVGGDDSNVGRHRLLPPAIPHTGSLQDLRPRHDSSKRNSKSIAGSPRTSRAMSGRDLTLSYLDFDDDDDKSIMRMNIQNLLRKREKEYISRSPFSVLCGTFNVNGKSPAGENLQPWLDSQTGDTVPDVIAVGFQELDNSNQAYLFAESTKEPEWVNALAHAIRDLYKNARFDKPVVIRLVGMMLVVFVRHQLVKTKTIRDIDSATVGCGLLGRLGNKGGVAVRMNVHSTSICFVASHLSAHLEESERRNQDFREINTRMTFSNVTNQETNVPWRIDHHDIVFWMGDLNYRIVGLSNEKCKIAIEQRHYDALFTSHDQLNIEMKLGKVFTGYKEGEITFRPTYKYDAGTNRWDSSEKARIPAWCDRVMWKINSDDVEDIKSVSLLSYQSHQNIFISDHKPVSAVFNVDARVVDEEKYDLVYRQIMRDFDRTENQQRPQAEPDRREIDFGEIKFLESFSVSITIKNTGAVPLDFVFKPTPDHPHGPSPRWLKVLPARGHIAQGHSFPVQLTAMIGADFVSQVALKKDRKFSDVLVLHLACGGDTFIPVKGTLALTCFGLPLSVLNSIATPIGLMDASEMSAIMATPPNELVKPFPLPKEVFRLVDRLSQPDALKRKELFREQGTLHDKIRIRDALDRTFPGVSLPGTIPSVVETLLDFLLSLPTPLIPLSLQDVCMEASSSTELSTALLEQAFSKKSPKHHSLFLYLLKYLAEVVRHRHENRLDIPFLAGLFAELAFRQSPTDRDDTTSARESHLPQPAINFILRLLAKEAELQFEEVDLMHGLRGGESQA